MKEKRRLPRMLAAIMLESMHLAFKEYFSWEGWRQDSIGWPDLREDTSSIHIAFKRGDTTRKFLVRVSEVKS